MPKSEESPLPTDTSREGVGEPQNPPAPKNWILNLETYRPEAKPLPGLLPELSSLQIWAQRQLASLEATRPHAHLPASLTDAISIPAARGATTPAQDRSVDLSPRQKPNSTSPSPAPAMPPARRSEDRETKSPKRRRRPLPRSDGDQGNKRDNSTTAVAVAAEAPNLPTHRPSTQGSRSLQRPEPPATEKTPGEPVDRPY